MRALHTEAELVDLPPPLRDALAACLERWRTSNVPYDPEGEFLLLVEPGDSIEAVCHRVSQGMAAWRSASGPPTGGRASKPTSVSRTMVAASVW